VLMTPKPLRAVSDRTPALLQLLWDRYAVLPRNLIFVEVRHRKVPYIHDDRYVVTVFDKERKSTGSIGVGEFRLHGGAQRGTRTRRHGPPEGN